MEGSAESVTYDASLVSDGPGELVAGRVHDGLGGDDGDELEFGVLGSEAALAQRAVLVVGEVGLVDGLELAVGDQMEGFQRGKSLDYADC